MKVKDFLDLLTVATSLDSVLHFVAFDNKLQCLTPDHLLLVEINMSGYNFPDNSQWTFSPQLKTYLKEYLKGDEELVIEHSEKHANEHHEKHANEHRETFAIVNKHFVWPSSGDVLQSLQVMAEYKFTTITIATPLLSSFRPHKINVGSLKVELVNEDSLNLSIALKTKTNSKYTILVNPYMIWRIASSCIMCATMNISVCEEKLVRLSTSLISFYLPPIE